MLINNCSYDHDLKGNKALRKSTIIKRGLRQMLIPIKRLPELSHCGTRLPDAIKSFLKNNAAEHLIASGDIHGKIWLVVGLPKSGSSVIGSILGEFAGECGLSKRHYADYMTRNCDSNLRPELVRTFVDGGVLKYHPLPTANNLKVIYDLKMRLFLTMRHPADQLVAYLLHARRSIEEGHSIIRNGLITDDVNDKNGNAITRDGLIMDHIYCVDKSIVEGDTNEALRHLIKDGYLMHVLQFLCDWLNVLDRFDGTVLTYEEMLEDRGGFLKRIAAAIGVPYQQKYLSMASTILDKNSLEKERGKLWSGKIGVYKEYLSDENISYYNNVIDKFSEVQDLSLLGSYYSNLRLG